MLVVPPVWSFVPTQHYAVGPRSAMWRGTRANLVLDVNSIDLALNPSSILVADSALNSALDTMRTIALGATAVIFFLAGLTTLFASIIMPAAAKELEKECLELNPDLWYEYQDKLEEGETIAQRPELMQELGAKLQPLLDAKIAALEGGEEAWLQGEGGSNAATPTTTPASSAPVIDVLAETADANDAWTSTPSLDLSVLTDQIETPTSTGDENDKPETAK